MIFTVLAGIIFTVCFTTLICIKFYIVHVLVSYILLLRESLQSIYRVSSLFSYIHVRIIHDC